MIYWDAFRARLFIFSIFSIERASAKGGAFDAAFGNRAAIAAAPFDTIS
jgi:hypothetical protein